MIKSAKVFFKKDHLLQDQIPEAKVSIQQEASFFSFSIEFTSSVTVSEVYLEVRLSEKIDACRSSSYQWEQYIEHPWVANSHSPKMMKTQSELILVGGSTQGCWEWNPMEEVLRWYFIHPQLTPLMTYDREDRRHFLEEQVIERDTLISDRILWTKGSVEEWARTPLGFLPIVCFTDHSDFDTLANLKVQRAFFNQLGIRVTKGFFLYDYTHKKENASFEAEASRNELIQWQAEGHELAYHALSQSYRGEKSEKEFQDFSSPVVLPPITTYIDHGFHPYNFTKQALGQWESWYSHMQSKGIRLIWSYLDSGEGNLFSVNQLDPRSFTLRSIIQSSKLEKKQGINRSRFSTLRNLIMFGVPEEIFWASKYFKGSLVGLRKKPSLSQIGQVLRKGFSFINSILASGIFKNLNSKLDQVFDNTRFAPFIFKGSNQSTTDIWVFQTLFVRDFEVVFSEKALEKLVNEKGAMIAHTYFSYANPGHEGRLFENESWEIRPQTKQAFERLANLVRSGVIWNPTLSELKSHFDKANQLTYQLEGDQLVIRNFQGITKSVR